MLEYLDLAGLPTLVGLVLRDATRPTPTPRRLDMRRLIRPASLFLIAAALLGTNAWAQLGFKAPQSVRLGLSVMSQVVANSGRLIAARRYGKLPGEARELEASIDSLQRGLGPQPPAFKKQLVPLIAQLRVASGALREAATHHRASMLPLVHDQLAQAVSKLIALFPEDVRPRPAAAGHRTGGPSPGLAPATQVPRNIR